MPQSLRRKAVIGFSLRLKVLASIGVLGGTAGVASLASFGTFTSTATAGQTVSSGAVSLSEGAGTFVNTLTVAASNLVPGDTVKRAFVLTNTDPNGGAVSSVTLSVASSTTTALNAASGLNALLQECSNGWVENSGAHTYTCSGTITTPLATTDVSGLASAVTLAGNLTANGDHSLLLTMTLPSTAGNSFTGLTSTFTYTFTGIQRAADSTH